MSFWQILRLKLLIIEVIADLRIGLKFMTDLLPRPCFKCVYTVENFVYLKAYLVYVAALTGLLSLAF